MRCSELRAARHDGKTRNYSAVIRVDMDTICPFKWSAKPEYRLGLPTKSKDQNETCG